MRRIDYVLSWSTKKEEKKREKGQETDSKKKKYRETFEKNLQIEGLQLEYDIKVKRHIGVNNWKSSCKVFYCLLSIMEALNNST